MALLYQALSESESTPSFHLRLTGHISESQASLHSCARFSIREVPNGSDAPFWELPVKLKQGNAADKGQHETVAAATPSLSRNSYSCNPLGEPPDLPT